MHRLYRKIFLGLCAWIFANQVDAQVYPADFAQVLVTAGLANPTALAFSPDGRIFAAEQGGKLRVIKNNALLPTPFVQLTVSSIGERGLIGITLDPEFATNNYLYLYYTVPGSPAHNRISRFTANGDVALPGSESIILELDPLSTATNHNGGAMHFGKDGKLYVAVGENATPANAQSMNTYHGKLLRINKDGSVPEGNPFTTGSEQQKRIWALGLRNPYTFSIHPESGRILVNDVGQVTWEEINDATVGGKNFGWPTTEGNFNQTTYPNFTRPLYAYQHGTGDGIGCAITAGTFFYPSATNYPSTYYGKYFIQDLCSRWINVIDVSGSQGVRSSFATTIPGNGLALETGTDGNLYFLSRSTSSLYKIIYNETTVPYITNHPADASIAEGQSVTFTVSSLGTTPFSYQWQKDGIDLTGATTAMFTISDAASDDSGNYRVVVSNTAGNATSDAASLSVIANDLPVALILVPAEGTTYAGGEIIEFSGAGDDAEDGLLPPEDLTWEINFHHDTHKHNEPPRVGISSGSFTVPTQGETSDNVWYSIILTATDAKGMTGKDSVKIFPRKSVIRVTTNPPGLEVIIDGQPFASPIEITSVEGVERSFGVSTSQSLEDVEYELVSWSNGGESTQTLTTPTDDLELIATFSAIVGVESSGNDMDVLLFPNPSDRQYVNVRISSVKQQHISIYLVDMISRDIIAQEENLSAGEHEIPFRFGKKGQGIYSVIVKTADKTIVKKLAIINY